jgi:AsmA protein
VPRTPLKDHPSPPNEAQVTEAILSVSSHLKRLTLGALGTVVLVAGVLVVAPYLVSESAARRAAIAELRNATGVEPQIDGNVRLVLLPSPAVRIEQIRLDDGIRPAFTAEALQATVRLLPLLVGGVEVASLTFDRAHLTVDIGANGAVQVGLPLRQRSAKETAEQPEIRFVDGTVHIRSSDAERIEPLTAVDAALAWSGAGLTATGSFRWKDTPATIGLSIADTMALRRGDRSAFRIRMETEPLKLGFEGGIAYRNGMQADGVIGADAKSLRAALPMFSAAPLTRAGLGAFKLKAQASLTSNSLALKGLSIELDGNRVDGGLTMKHAEGRTVVQATLASEVTDLTPYSGGLAVTNDDGQDWNREPIDVSGFDGLDLDVRLSSGKVVVRKTEFTRVAATATLRNGAFTLSVGDAQFHGGTLKGRASLEQQAGAAAAVKIEANVANFDLSNGLTQVVGISRLEGKGTLAANLESSGRHVQEIARGLKGIVTLAAANGAMSGINVEQVLRRLERRPLSGAPDFAGGRTPFDKLNARMRIYEGNARIEEATLESPLIRVRLGGETSIVYRDFDLRGTATLTRSPAAAANAPQTFDLPFVVIGSWDRPFLLPDPTALIQRSGAAAPLIEAARKQAARRNAAPEEIPEQFDSPIETGSNPATE